MQRIVSRLPTFTRNLLNSAIQPFGTRSGSS
jgi:hypothetical protein